MLTQPCSISILPLVSSAWYPTRRMALLGSFLSWFRYLSTGPPSSIPPVVTMICPLMAASLLAGLLTSWNLFLAFLSCLASLRYSG